MSALDMHPGLPSQPFPGYGIPTVRAHGEEAMQSQFFRKRPFIDHSS
jgi:hypothetical protein